MCGAQSGSWQDEGDGRYRKRGARSGELKGRHRGETQVLVNVLGRVRSNCVLQAAVSMAQIHSCPHIPADTKELADQLKYNRVFPVFNYSPVFNTAAPPLEEVYENPP